MGKTGSKELLRSRSASEQILTDKDFDDFLRSFNEEELADADLAQVLTAAETMEEFLTKIFRREVEVTESKHTLFRGSSLATRVISHCFKTFGSTYLKDLLAPHIRPLSKNRGGESTGKGSETEHQSLGNEPSTSTSSSSSIKTFYSEIKHGKLDRRLSSLSTISFEIDSTRLEKDGNINTNQRHLLRLTTRILEAILASEFPLQLKAMCSCLRRVINEKFPDTDSSTKTVGTVIFLRFINPAIVSPLESGIISKPLPPRPMRGLMLASKILQNIANNVEFSKEEHMLPINDFVRNQFEPVNNWVRGVCQI